jgi:hypothetical protein
MAGNAVEFGDFQRLLEGEGREDGRQAAGEHGLAAAGGRPSGSCGRLGSAGVPMARTDDGGMPALIVREGQLQVDSYVPKPLTR